MGAGPIDHCAAYLRRDFADHALILGLGLRAIVTVPIVVGAAIASGR